MFPSRLWLFLTHWKRLDLLEHTFPIDRSPSILGSSLQWVNASECTSFFCSMSIKQQSAFNFFFLSLNFFSFLLSEYGLRALHRKAYVPIGAPKYISISWIKFESYLLTGKNAFPPTPPPPNLFFVVLRIAVAKSDSTHSDCVKPQLCSPVNSPSPSLGRLRSGVGPLCRSPSGPTRERRADQQTTQRRGCPDRSSRSTSSWGAACHRPPAVCNWWDRNLIAKWWLRLVFRNGLGLGRGLGD